MRGAGVRLRGGLTALALLASLLTGVATASSASASDAGTFVASINSARRSAGLAPLTSNSTLTSVARSWAGHLAATQHLAHNPGLTSQVSGWKVLGENVGSGGSASSIHAAFMASAPHRANILSSRYSQVGVAVASGGGQLWVVEVFRLPTGASAPARRPASKPTTTSRPRTTSTPKTTPRTPSRPAAAASSRRTTRTSAAHTPSRSATRVAAKPKAHAAPPRASAPRTVAAVPSLDRSALTLGAVLEHVRLAVTGSGDAVGAWSWLLRHLLGLRTTIGA